MPVWNMKLFLLLTGLTATDAFLAPKSVAASNVVINVTPDQWLGSSPSDHYGGAVGPKFEAFEKQPVNEDDMEAQEKRLADINYRYPTKEEVAAQQVPPTMNYEQWKQQEKNRNQMPRSQISPLSWDGGSMEAGFAKAQTKSAGGADGPFASRSGSKKQEYTTPRFATPSGTPKMIGTKESTSTEEARKNTGPVVSSQPSNGNVNQNSVRLPPMEGIPQAKFSSRPDQPGDWFYHDVPRGEGSRRPTWPAQSYASQPGNDVATKVEVAAPVAKPAAAKPEWERPAAVDPEELLEPKAAGAKPAAPKEEEQPKADAPEGATEEQLLQKVVVEPIAPKKEEPPKTVPESNPPEPQKFQEISPEAPVLKQWKQQGAERRKPPSEGWPQAKFSSRPDQPGDWFYHDVPEDSRRRPSWPVQSYARSYGRPEETVGYQSVNLPPKQPKVNAEPTEEPYAAKENTRRPQDYQVQQATPAGQPKMIGFTKTKPKPESVAEPPKAMSEPPKTVVENPQPVIHQPPMDSPEGVTTGGDVLLTYDHWRSQGRATASAEKLPPMEGIPQARFTSAPDQPGGWFYDDVSTSSSRPRWPNQQQSTSNRPDGWLQTKLADKERAITQEQIDAAEELKQLKAEQQGAEEEESEEGLVSEEEEEESENSVEEDEPSDEDIADDKMQHPPQGYY